MVVGQRNWLSANTRAYPRYTNLRRHLIGLFPRVNRTLERNKLTGLISQGQERWQNITKCVEACISESAAVSIYVFASQQSHIDSINDDLVRDKSVFEKGDKDRKLPQESMEIEGTGLESLPQGKFTRFAPEIIVYVKAKSESIDVVEKRTAVLEKIRNEHLVIYDVTTKKAELYRNFEKADAKLLSQNIEFLLEENVICLLEEIIGFVTKFVPGFGDPFSQGVAVPTQITSQLQDSLVIEHVLKDFLPGKDSGKEMMETDVDEKQRKNTIFHQNIRMFLALKAKCLFCDLTSKRLGIPGAFINHFMVEGFFDFEQQFQKGLTDNMLPALPDDTYNLTQQFRKTGLAYHCHKLCNSLIPEAETFVQKIYTDLKTLKKIQFEMFGLLQLSPKAVTVPIPKVETISTTLQNELLDLDCVVTCGTLYGVLTVVAKNTINNEETNEIHNVMKQHKVDQYEIAITDGWKQHADPNSIQNGSEIVARFILGKKMKFAEDKKENYAKLPDEIKGTLGCFVKQNIGDELFAVTCYHCVDESYFIDKVNTQRNGENQELGVRSSYCLYDPNTLDIALIRVNENMRTGCSLNIHKQDGIGLSDRWIFSKRTADSKDLEKWPVYKKGFSTEMTTGYVVGCDFKSKHIEKDASSGDFQLHHTIFIANHQGNDVNHQGNEVNKFSKPGDSGSVVCIEVTPVSYEESTYVEVISLLCGEIILKNPKTNLPSGTYSYSCQLRELLTTLNINKNSNIKID